MEYEIVDRVPAGAKDVSKDAKVIIVDHIANCLLIGTTLPLVIVAGLVVARLNGLI